MGCSKSKEDSTQVSDDDTINVVQKEEKFVQDEEKKEKKETRTLSADGLKIPKENNSLKKRKGSNQEDRSFSRECSNCSTNSNSSVVKKRSLINRISNFRKSKRTSMQTLDKSFSSSCSKESKIEPTQDEVESWAVPNNGFENMMSSQAGREIFLKFLKKEFSSENLIFWSACEDLRQVKDEKYFKEKVEDMFTTFLEASSPQEVSLDFKVKERVMEQRDQPSETMFDEAQSKIYTLMHRDSFPRFLTSSFYKDLLPEDKTDSIERDNNISKQNNVEGSESDLKENKVATIVVDNSDTDQSSSDKPTSIMDAEPANETKDISKYPIHQDSLLDPNVTRELSKDSPNEFRTVTLDTEYDKLLNLIE